MKITQDDRVLRALEQHPHGITRHDFEREPVIDGRAPVLRLAARIAKLRARGHRIITAGRREGVSIYRLENAATSAAAPAPPAAAPSAGEPAPRSIADATIAAWESEAA